MTTQINDTATIIADAYDHGDANEIILLAIAKSLNTPIAMLNRLSYSNDEDVRVAVANNPNTSPDTLHFLSGVDNNFEAISVAVAENPNTAADTLHRLSRSNFEGVRVAVAENPNTTAEVLATMPYNDDLAVMLAVAENPNTPKLTESHFDTKSKFEDFKRLLNFISELNQAQN